MYNPASYRVVHETDGMRIRLLLNQYSHPAYEQALRAEVLERIQLLTRLFSDQRWHEGDAVRFQTAYRNSVSLQRYLAEFGQFELSERLLSRISEALQDTGSSLPGMDGLAGLSRVERIPLRGRQHVGADEAEAP